MRFNRYRFQLLIRLLLLSVTIFFLAKTGLNQEFRGTFLGLAGAILLQFYSLIRYHENTHKQVNRFFNAVRFDDFAEQFQHEGEGKLQRELSQRLNNVMVKFREIRSEKEANLHYFEAIVQHIGTGIITYKPSGEILLLNKAAKKILQTIRANTLEDLAEISTEFADVLQYAEHNGKALIQLRRNGELVNLSVHVIELVLLREPIRIASLQNIRAELEEKETEAWQALVKVLTHEIMNSVTPIASLSASANDEILSFTDTDLEEVTVLKTELEEIGRCLQTISRRSDGLIKFLNDFRSLSINKQPQATIFNVCELLSEIKTLYRDTLQTNNIVLQLDFQNDSLLLSADRSMIEQVLINMVKNALEAVGEKPEKKIVLKAYQDEQSRVNIEVSDNGSGMTPEAQAKIFIPFYTTKAAGSGIGLSLSRQIMRLHKGSISVQSELNKGTIFTLKF